MMNEGGVRNAEGHPIGTWDQVTAFQEAEDPKGLVTIDGEPLEGPMYSLSRTRLIEPITIADLIPLVVTPNYLLKNLTFLEYMQGVVWMIIMKHGFVFNGNSCLQCT